MSELEASKGVTKVGRIKDPLYKDSYFGITPPTFIPPFEAPGTETLDNQPAKQQPAPAAAAMIYDSEQDSPEESGIDPSDHPSTRHTPATPGPLLPLETTTCLEAVQPGPRPLRRSGLWGGFSVCNLLIEGSCGGVE